MRVLFVSHRFLPKYTAGTEVYGGLMAHALARAGHQVRVFTGDPSAQSEYDTVWEGLPVRGVPWGIRPWQGAVSTFLAGFINPAVERSFDAYCRDFEPDVVHIQHLLGLSPRLPSIARRRGAKVVITLHDYWFVCSNTWLFRWTREQCPGPGNGFYCGGCALHRLHKGPNRLLMLGLAPMFALRTKMLRRSLMAADYRIAPSQAVASRFVGQGIPPGALRVVPHGMISGPAVARSPASASTGLRFVYVGSLTPPKGADIAIRAFNRLAVENIHLDIYGNLTDDAEYAAELRALATHPGIAFKGPLAHERLYQTLAAAHLLLLPSLWDEPFSIITDEALHAGVPVLTSDRGAPKERLIAGVNGLVAAAGDVEDWLAQMQSVADNPEFLSQLQRGARLLKQVAGHARELEAVYQQLTAAAN